MGEHKLLGLFAQFCGFGGVRWSPDSLFGAVRKGFEGGNCFGRIRAFGSLFEILQRLCYVARRSPAVQMAKSQIEVGVARNIRQFLFAIVEIAAEVLEIFFVVFQLPIILVDFGKLFEKPAVESRRLFVKLDRADEVGRKPVRAVQIKARGVRQHSTRL